MWVHGNLILCSIADQTLVVGKRHIRGRCPVTLVVGNDFDTIILPHTHASTRYKYHKPARVRKKHLRVRCTKINANCFRRRHGEDVVLVLRGIWNYESETWEDELFWTTSLYWDLWNWRESLRTLWKLSIITWSASSIRWCVSWYSPTGDLQRTRVNELM